MNKENKEKAKYTYEELSEKYLEKKVLDKKTNKMKSLASDYQMIVSFIVTLVILIFLGIFLGNKLDQKLKTSPLFILLFTFLGIGASYRNLIKDANRKK
ncbi:AtpZ/AtpI family protein [Mycoplasmatota bacterium]|nr:AtpZ/AtpI family protein [Mycoplasmatota bacterium]